MALLIIRVRAVAKRIYKKCVSNNSIVIRNGSSREESQFALFSQRFFQN